MSINSSSGIKGIEMDQWKTSNIAVDSYRIEKLHGLLNVNTYSICLLGSWRCLRMRIHVFYRLIKINETLNKLHRRSLFEMNTNRSHGIQYITVFLFIWNNRTCFSGFFVSDLFLISALLLSQKCCDEHFVVTWFVMKLYCFYFHIVAKKDSLEQSEV